MKRTALMLLTALTLASCAPTQMSGGLGSTGATALKVPHPTLAGLVVTVHNPTTTALTGDTSRQMRPVVTVVGEAIKPAPDTTCKREITAGLRWNCPVPNIEPGDSEDLRFAPDGPAPAITFAFGTGYLGNAVPVPLALTR